MGCDGRGLQKLGTMSQGRTLWIESLAWLGEGPIDQTLRRYDSNQPSVSPQFWPNDESVTQASSPIGHRGMKSSTVDRHDSAGSRGI